MNTNFKPDTFGLSEGATLDYGSPTLRRRALRENGHRMQAVLEAKSLMDRAWAGDKRSYNTLHEALTTSDLFRSAAGEVLDIEMLQAYETIEVQWKKIATSTSLRNFKPKDLRTLMMGSAGFQKVPELNPYPMGTGPAITEAFISVAKFGERWAYSFEAQINDELGELQSVPRQWGTRAGYTEDDAVLAQLANPVTGAPNTAFFNATNKNLGTGALTADNLMTAMQNVKTSKVDANGRMLRAPQLQLVTGPGLSIQANLVLNSNFIRYTDSTTGQVTELSNPFQGVVQHVEMANLPGKAWFILPVPNSARPAFFLGHLVGYETPDLRFAADQGQSISGGALGQSAGSFENDSIAYRVRHICGAAVGDPTFTWASDGLGA